MTTPTAERYARTGTAIPQIYPGTLRGLASALEDTERASRTITDTPHRLIAIYGKARVILRVFHNGTCTWAASEENTENY